MSSLNCGWWYEVTDNSNTTVRQSYNPATKSGRRRFENNHFIFREHEVGDLAFIIAEGRVEILKETPKGPVSMRVLKKGAMFGEMALIDNEPRMASAKAINGPVEVLVINHKLFNRKLKNQDPFIRGLIKFLVATARNSA